MPQIEMQPITSQEINQLTKSEKAKRGRARYVLRRAGIIKCGYPDSIDTLQISKLFAITDDELLKERGCGPKTLKWINKFKSELKTVLFIIK